MSGLYLHVPFCRRRCPYCDFAVYAGQPRDLPQRYLTCLQHELQSILQASDEPELKTIFVGGGTPTLLPADALGSLLELCRREKSLAAEAEITVEANPEELDEPYLENLRHCGYNRLSLGVQSFDDEVLAFLGRQHRAGQISAVVTHARRAGWENLSFDLIFGAPCQTLRGWQEGLQQALALEPEHLSCYSLTIEEKTVFARQISRGAWQPIASSLQADLMASTRQILEDAGYRQYEISNFARPGYASRHNLNYWRGGDYLAAGCGAHGHRAGHRWWNVTSTLRYLELMEAGLSPRAGEERLEPGQRLEERVLLGLRLHEGFSLSETSSQLGLDAEALLQPRLDELVRAGMLRCAAGRVMLEPQARVVADAVAARLMR